MSANFSLAVYLADKEENLSDDKLTKLARLNGMYPKVLIKNYKNICAINDIFENSGL